MGAIQSQLSINIIVGSVSLILASSHIAKHATVAHAPPVLMATVLLKVFVF